MGKRRRTGTEGEKRWQYGQGIIERMTGKRGETFKATIYLGLNPDGKQNRPSRTFPTQRAAEHWIDDMGTDSRRGALADTRKRRVKDVLREYLEHQQAEHAKGNIRPRTLADYTRINAKLTEVLPNVEITALTIQHVQTGITTLATSYAADAPRTEVIVKGRRKLAAPKKATPQDANRALLQLRRVLTFAQSRDWVIKNVAQHVKPFKVGAEKGGEDSPTDAQKVWEPSEVQRFLNVAKGHRLHALFHLALSYGPRVGELMALRWTDIDFTAGRIRIARSYDPMNGLGAPKWGSARTVDITEGTLNVLREHRARQEQERSAKGDKYDDNGLVFPTLQGTYTDHSGVRRAFDLLIQWAGVNRIKVHGMRHTAASAMIRAGYDVVHVASLLGHKDPSLTLKVYSHCFREHSRVMARDVSSLYHVPTPAPAPASAPN